MSIVMEILEKLWNTKIYYKGVPVNIFGIPIFWDDKKGYSKNSFDATVLRLKDRDLIKIKDKKWILTKKGKEYFENKKKLYTKFSSPFKLNSPKNLLLMFDIPESKKSERNWLRWHLIEFQYHMIQKSVWIGPSPLPKKFGSYLKEIGLYDFIKTFKLAKPYQIKTK